MLGCIDWRLIYLLQLDHVYTATYFLALLGLLGASLWACTLTRQLPAVRVARRHASPRMFLTFVDRLAFGQGMMMLS